MTATSYITIWCDNKTAGEQCMTFIETAYRTAKAARASARRVGWTVGLHGGKDLCPSHDRLLGASEGDKET